MYTPLALASQTREPTLGHRAILPWLDMLRQLYPPRALLLVGAGNGSSPWVRYLMGRGYRNVTFIEADETTSNRLKIATQEHPDWVVKSHVIASDNVPAAFYTASLQTESGLLEPESLRSLWPNLQTTHKQTRQTVTLAKLQEDAETPANWLMIDCLPALSLVQGAAGRLDDVGVIVARVLIDEADVPDDNTAFAGLDRYLRGHGFRCMVTETGRHPSVGHALFVRDIEMLSDARIAAERQIQANAVSVRQLTEACDKQAGLAVERQEQIDALTKAKVQQEKDITSLVAQLAEMEKQLQRHESERAEAEHRQRLMLEQLAKAEAQIDLIKDLLLREPGL